MPSLSNVVLRIKHRHMIIRKYFDPKRAFLIDEVNMREIETYRDQRHCRRSKVSRRLGGQGRAPVGCISCTACDADLDSFSVLSIGNVAMELNVGPMFRGLLVQSLGLLGSVLLVIEIASIRVELAPDLLVLLHRLQSVDVPGSKVGANAMALVGASRSPWGSAGIDVPRKFKRSPWVRHHLCW